MKLSEEMLDRILDNYRIWAMDDQPDPAEVHYYTISPDFRDYVKPSVGSARYNPDSAMMVELVLEYMHELFPTEHMIIKMLYADNLSKVALAKKLGVDRNLVNTYLEPRARDVFNEQWCLTHHRSSKNG